MSAVSTGTVRTVKGIVQEFFSRHTYGWGGRDSELGVAVERRFEQVILPVLRDQPSTAELLIAVGRVLQILNLSVYPEGVRWLEGRLRGILGR